MYNSHARPKSPQRFAAKVCHFSNGVVPQLTRFEGPSAVQERVSPPVLPLLPWEDFLLRNTGSSAAAATAGAVSRRGRGRRRRRYLDI